MNNEDTSQNRQRINALKQMLAAHDDRGRKLAFEAAKEIKSRFPEAEMPYLAKYLEAEEQAETWRAEIRRLEQAEDGGE